MSGGARTFLVHTWLWSSFWLVAIDSVLHTAATVMRKASGRIVGLHLSDSIQVSPVRLVPCPAGREVNAAEGSHGSVIQLTSAAPQLSLSSATYFIRGREGTSRESAVLAEQIVGPPPKKNSTCLQCRTSSTVTGVTMCLNVRASQCFEKFNNIVLNKGQGVGVFFSSFLAEKKPALELETVSASLRLAA